MLTHLEHLVEEARRRGPRRLAVAYGQDAHTLHAVADAAAAGIVTPVIYGDKDTVEGVCASEGIDASRLEIIDVKGDTACVAGSSAPTSTCAAYSTRRPDCFRRADC